MIGHHGTAGASFFPSRTKHEVIDDELALAAKKIRKSLIPLRSGKDVILLHFDPGKFTTQPADLVTLPGKFFFFLQQLFSSGYPLFFIYNCVAYNCVIYGFCGTHCLRHD